MIYLIIIFFEIINRALRDIYNFNLIFLRVLMRRFFLIFYTSHLFIARFSFNFDYKKIFHILIKKNLK